MSFCETIELGITALAGIFPGARDIASFWTNLRRASVAPLSELEPLWKVPKQHYFAQWPGRADRTYLDRGFCIEDDPALVAFWGDRQVAAGRAVVERALRDLEERGGLPDAKSMALVVATSWSAPSFFAADATKVLGALGCPMPGPLPRPYDPEQQLAALADVSLIGGERIAVDSACASSLYALDMALGLLRQERARAVVLLGLCVGVPLYLFIGLSKLQALDPNGALRPFFADAAGMVPGECAGVVVLERVDRGPGRGRVMAVVRGLGLSADGADRSIFAPSAEGQALAYERAYSKIDPGTVDYVETHGTGTPVGDAAELRSLERFFAPYLRAQRKLPIGSVKALIGHTLSAAGIASLIKGVLMLKERIIVPHIQGGPTNPILEHTPFELPVSESPWPVTAGRPARMGISCFGFGGANAHVVLEEFVAHGEQRTLEVQANPRIGKVAICGLELAPSQGSVASVSENDTLSAARISPAPLERFGFVDKRLGTELLPSLYLPCHAEIDAADLRMGPSAIGRLDPLQLLVTDLGRRLLSQSCLTSDGRSTGVVAIGNLGGQMGCRFFRRFAQLFRTDVAVAQSESVERLLSLQLTTEGLSSSLPSMLSGFPAFHLNLKGFHETLSGGAGAFWTALGLSSSWLEESCHELLLLVTRQLVSPIDIEEAVELARLGVASGEVAGGLLLKPVSQGCDPGEDALAILHGVVPTSMAADWPSACRSVGVAPEKVDLIDVSELSAAAMSSSGSSEKSIGYLKEGSGLVCLAGLLSRPGRFGVVEVKRDGELVATVVVERRSVWREKSEPAKSPYMLDFSFVRPSSRSLFVPGAIDSETAILWLRTTASTVVQFLETQSAMARIVTGEASATPMVATSEVLDASGLRSDPKNVVIADCQALNTGALRARLVVDEQHPYFFDHPLDHVPGILLLCGLIELSEIGLQRLRGACPEGECFFVKSLELRFYQFTEKDRPADIVFDLSQSSTEGVWFEGGVEQAGQRVARCKLLVDRGRAPQSHREETAEPHTLVEDISSLHKRWAHNVLITAMAPLSEDTAICRTLPPPKGHTLSESRCGEASILYLLEATRQATTYAAHELLGLSHGLQMNLIEIHLSMHRPCALAESLSVVTRIGGLRQIEQMVLGDVQVSFMDRQGEVGLGSVKSQAVDRQTYAAMRRRKT